jgi:hypothetical protein
MNVTKCGCVWGFEGGGGGRRGLVALVDYPWSSGGCLLGLMQAWVASMNSARTFPPTSVPKIMLMTRLVVTGLRKRSRAAPKRGQLRMTCVGVCRSA